MQPALSLPVQNPAFFRLMSDWFIAMPHCKALGIEFVQGERGRATTCLPFAEHFIANAKERIMHGGVITTLIDTTCGLTVFSL